MLFAVSPDVANTATKTFTNLYCPKEWTLPNATIAFSLWAVSIITLSGFFFAGYAFFTVIDCLFITNSEDEKTQTVASRTLSQDQTDTQSIQSEERTDRPSLRTSSQPRSVQEEIPNAESPSRSSFVSYSPEAMQQIFDLDKKEQEYLKKKQADDPRLKEKERELEDVLAHYNGNAQFMSQKEIKNSLERRDSLDKEIFQIEVNFSKEMNDLIAKQCKRLENYTERKILDLTPLVDFKDS